MCDLLDLLGNWVDCKFGGGSWIRGIQIGEFGGGERGFAWSGGKLFEKQSLCPFFSYYGGVRFSGTFVVIGNGRSLTGFRE